MVQRNIFVEQAIDNLREDIDLADNAVDFEREHCFDLLHVISVNLEAIKLNRPSDCTRFDFDAYGKSFLFTGRDGEVPKTEYLREQRKEKTR